MRAGALVAPLLAACVAGGALAAGPAAPSEAAQPATAASVPAASLPAASVPAASIPAAPAPAASVPAAPSSAARAPAPALTVTAGPSAGNLLQTIAALCLVLGLLAALAWFLKRYGPKAQGGNASLRIVGALNLGGRERIMVVEVGEQWIVVGASPGRVNALATLPRPLDAPAAAAPDTYQPSATSFSEWLKQTIDKRK